MSNDFAMKTPNGCLDLDTVRYPVFVQPKLDGLRGIAVRSGSTVTWYSYSGKPLWNTEHLTENLPKTPGTYDGEIIWPGHPFADAYGLCKRQDPDPKKYPNHEQDKKELQFHVFDFLHEGEWEHRTCFRPMRERDDFLRRMPWNDVVQRVPLWVVRDQESLLDHHSRFLDQGLEGTMVKKIEGNYHWKRHPDWHRHKPTQTEDFRIIGAVEGKGKWKGALGAFLLDLGLPKPQEAGGGRIDLATRTDWWNRRTELQGKFVEVTFKCRTPDGYLREPILIRLREDKE